MKDWLKNNAKWVIPIVTFVAGGIGGYFKAVNDFEVHLTKVELRIDQSANDVKTEIMEFIQIRIFTDFYTKLHKQIEEGE